MIFDFIIAPRIVITAHSHFSFEKLFDDNKESEMATSRSGVQRARYQACFTRSNNNERRMGTLIRA